MALPRREFQRERHEIGVFGQIGGFPCREGPDVGFGLRRPLLAAQSPQLLLELSVSCLSL